jgi:hypothetical protein
VKRAINLDGVPEAPIDKPRAARRRRAQRRPQVQAQPITIGIKPSTWISLPAFEGTLTGLLPDSYENYATTPIPHA